MSVRLLLTLHAVEGSVIRAIGLAERRGWTLAGLELTPAGGDLQRLRLDLEPRQDSRNVEVLKRQLERLYDVERVDLPVHAGAAS